MFYLQFVPSAFKSKNTAFNNLNTNSVTFNFNLGKFKCECDFSLNKYWTDFGAQY